MRLSMEVGSPTLPPSRVMSWADVFGIADWIDRTEDKKPPPIDTYCRMWMER